MDRFVGVFLSRQCFTHKDVLRKWACFLSNAHLVAFLNYFIFHWGCLKEFQDCTVHLSSGTGHSLSSYAIQINLFLVFVLLLCFLVSRGLLTQIQIDGKFPFHFSCQEVIALVIDEMCCFSFSFNYLCRLSAWYTESVGYYFYGYSRPLFMWTKRPNIEHDLESEKITCCYEPCGIHYFWFTQAKHNLNQQQL